MKIITTLEPFYLGYWIFRMWDVQDVECWRCGMLVMWNVGGCGMFGTWRVKDVVFWKCGMFGMWNVWDAGC